jgi:P-type conjugative transfer protein TrbJ
MKPTILAAKIALVIVLLTGLVSPAQAGIPVIDGGNLVQNVISTIESITQTLKQIEEYKTQLEQYENQLQNSLTLSRFEWDDAQTTMRNLRNSVDTLNMYKNRLGSLEKYLEKYQDLAHYENSPCFNESGECTAEERAAMEANMRLIMEARKNANDDLFRVVDQQHGLLQDDADTLASLQTNSQSADGQMQALQYANQFASQQTNQLLQIRGMMLAQQNAMATRDAAEADEVARDAALKKRFLRGGYTQSTNDSF